MSGSAAAAAPVKLAEIPGRGRALVATHAIKPGEILLSESPLLLYPASKASNYCPLCYRSLGTGGHRCLSGAAPSSWLSETIARLRSHVRDPDLFSQACFLATAYDLAASSPSAFSLLLSLQGSDTDPSAPILHSLLSSLAPPPLPPGFSPDLTAALLAKDKLNAFGLMEPFREDDSGERKVRAYGIYPKASFFNHDCLPNACRFDYVDGDGENNTAIVVRAIHEIPEGREVCLSYFPVNWNYKERQERLLQDYGFKCECDRCQVEKNWKDDDDEEEEEEGMECMDEEEGLEGMEEDNGGAGAEDDGDFPHAYFFIRYVCDRENCGGTLAPLPPSLGTTTSNVMECNVCGRFKTEDDFGGDGSMLDE
ncbi:hypothetical protein J5N97_016597 [Dioscorea zingiberensis]|uniref:SET domain-containing protein n=1 Tax=Dioscorea zingiberensis TaxID=325984 RepID=A0A9D5CK54_9LILI|nr:hypothetical protein J5N97_016597 [Dioscorea zingiberensis]